MLAFIFSLLPIVLFVVLLRRRTVGRRLPPGPSGLPIIGHLHVLGQLPHQTLRRLAQKHGPIMSIRLGLVPTIVVSSPRAAELFLRAHDTNFASRPRTEASERLSYGSKGMAFSEYGPYWRGVKRLCNTELLCAAKIEGFEAMRREEVGRLVGRLRAARGVVDVGEEVGRAVEDMSCRMVLGRSSDERFDLKGAAREVLVLVGAFNVTDFLPFLAPLDIQGLTRRLKAVSKNLDKIFEHIIHEHERVATETQNSDEDFVGVMLSLKNKPSSTNNDLSFTIARENIKAILLDMIVASLDTSAVSVEWAMSELLRNPRVMQKLQEELRNTIGKDRMVEEADLGNLEYLDAVIKETQRLHPAAPLLIPRMCIEDIVIDGYFIPKNSRIIVNGWALGRDAKAWTNAEDFIPERFIGSDVDVRGKHFQLIPFGSGRRGCPGVNLGLTNIRLVLAQLVHAFNWELPEEMSPNELDMSEKFGLSVSRAKPLLATPTYRLRNGH